MSTLHSLSHEIFNTMKSNEFKAVPIIKGHIFKSKEIVLNKIADLSKLELILYDAITFKKPKDLPFDIDESNKLVFSNKLIFIDNICAIPDFRILMGLLHNSQTANLKHQNSESSTYYILGNTTVDISKYDECNQLFNKKHSPIRSEAFCQRYSISDYNSPYKDQYADNIAEKEVSIEKPSSIKDNLNKLFG